MSIPEQTQATELLTATQVADRFRVSASSVTRWARAGKFPAIRLPGGSLRFRLSDVEAFLAGEGAA